MEKGTKTSLKKAEGNDKRAEIKEIKWQPAPKRINKGKKVFFGKAKGVEKLLVRPDRKSVV